MELLFDILKILGGLIAGIVIGFFIAKTLYAKVYEEKSTN